MWRAVFGIGLGAVVGCSGAGRSEGAATGTLGMALTATGSSGATYRLSNATIAIGGPVMQTIAPPPDSPSFTVPLPSGPYTALLQSGWFLEKSQGMGFAAVNAQLLSPNPTNFVINPNLTTNLVYQFSTDGTVINIGNGNLAVSISVTETTGGGMACDPADPMSCGPGMWCEPFDNQGQPNPTCKPAGTVPVGQPCDQGPCVAGAECFLIDPATNLTQCLQLCTVGGPSTCPMGVECQPLQIGTVGVCF
jgi:hypothetical protein